jgi:hypothetical protein
MDYFSNIFKIKELSERRTLQLRLEETMDNNLYQTYKECPDTTLKFLLTIRKINRINSYELYNSGILQYTDVITRTLNTNEDLYNKYSLINPTCNNLFDFINK